MATGGGQVKAEEQRHSWDPAEYDFDPYNLTAVRVGKAAGSPSPSPEVGCSKDGAAQAAAQAAAAAAPPVKRRPGRQRRTSVLCQVPGCEEELVNAKKYYRRYRICQRHCAVPAIMIDGLRQRFCQQCGRFHDVAEFEGAKRSCKRKLKRHNERRRSALPGSSGGGGGSAGKKKASASWNSQSEGEETEGEEAACQESSGSEPRPPAARRQGTRRAPPRAAKAARATKAAAEPAGASGHSSAASQDTSSPPLGQRSVDASPPAVGSLTPTPPGSAQLEPAWPSAAAPPLQAAAAAAGAGVPGEGWPLPHQRGLSASGSGSLDATNEAPGAAALMPQLRPAQPPASWPAPASLQCARSMPLPPAGPQVAVCAVPPRAASLPEQAALGPSASTDLDQVLQQLLTDEELRALHLGPLEPTLAFTPLARPPSVPLPPELQLQAPLGQVAGPGGFEEGDVAMGLLEELPLMPLPDELRHSAAGTAGSTHSARTGNWQLASSSSIDMDLDLPGWQCAEPLAAPPPLPRAPTPLNLVPQPLPSSVSPTVLATAQSMLVPPSQVAAGTAIPLVGYGQRPAGGAGAVGAAPAAAAGTTLLARFSLKVFQCRPEQLAPAVREELHSMLQVRGLLESYMRPGCTHLTLNALMTPERIAQLKAEGLSSVATQLLESCGANEALGNDMILQFGGELAVVKRRKVLAVISLANSPALVPTLAQLVPLAVHATPAAPAATPLLLRGRLLCGDHDLVLARQQGANLAVELLGCGEEQGWEWAHARLLGLLPGFADVEVQHGSFLSPARALVALPCPNAVAEVRQLERGGAAAGIDCLDSFLRDMGLVVQYLSRNKLAAEGCPCPSYGPALLVAIAGKARGLVAAAVARGWVAVTKMLLPAVTADGTSASDAVAAMDACCPEGASLLHVAVGTGSVPLVDCLSAWGAPHGRPWLVDAPAGSEGVTPLHVAALLPNRAVMRAALAGMVPCIGKLWGLVQAHDGTTPESLCEALAAAEGPAAEPSAASTASTSTSSGGGGAGTSSAAAAVEAPSGSKPAAELEALAQDASKPGKPGAEADDSCCRSGRRRNRSALKQHLDELHLTTMLSEVESLSSSTSAQDTRPLASALSGTLAAGAALMRMLRGGGRQ